MNPYHLEPVTPKVNIMRGESPWVLNARKVECPRKHKYTPENTAVRPDGTRTCRECLRQATARYRARKKLASQVVSPD